MEETYTTAFHLPFHQSPKVNQEMSKLYSQIMAVLVNENVPLLQSIVKMNEDFEQVYVLDDTSSTVMHYVTKFGLVIENKKIKNPNKYNYSINKQKKDDNEIWLQMC